jgi:hypothetical protein
MKHMKTVVIPADTKQEVDFVTCDLCGEKIKCGYHEIDEVKVTYKQGRSYPEGSWGDETSVDMCGDCFNEKLVPWLKSQGANPVTTDFIR